MNTSDQNIPNNYRLVEETSILIERPDYTPPIEYIETSGKKTTIIHTRTLKTKKVYKSINNPNLPPIVIEEEKEIRDDSEFETELFTCDTKFDIHLTNENRGIKNENRATDNRPTNNSVVQAEVINERIMQQKASALKKQINEDLNKLRPESPKKDFENIVKNMAEFQKTSNDQRQIQTFNQVIAKRLEESARITIHNLSENSDTLRISNALQKLAYVQSFSSEIDINKYLDEIRVSTEKVIEQKLRSLILKNLSDFQNIIEDINFYCELSNYMEELHRAYMESILEKLKNFIEEHMKIIRNNPKNANFKNILLAIEYYLGWASTINIDSTAVDNIFKEIEKIKK